MSRLIGLNWLLEVSSIYCLESYSFYNWLDYSYFVTPVAASRANWPHTSNMHQECQCDGKTIRASTPISTKIAI
ncbi:MAG: hypothetical protein ABIR84_07245, partial [Candidatus Nitrotoga sp.]